MSPERVFRIGHPEIPAQGFLLGGGGGVSRLYKDIVVDCEHFDARVRILRYQLPPDQSGPIPPNRESVDIAAALSDELEKYMLRLKAMGFWKMEFDPPLSTMTHYFVAVDKDLGLHFVIWWEDSMASLPKELFDVYNEIRDHIVGRIDAEFPRAVPPRRTGLAGLRYWLIGAALVGAALVGALAWSIGSWP